MKKIVYFTVIMILLISICQRKDIYAAETGYYYGYGTITNADGLGGESQDKIGIDGYYYEVSDDFDYNDVAEIWLSDEKDIVYKCRKNDGNIVDIFPVNRICQIRVKTETDPSSIYYSDGKYNHDGFTLKVKVKNCLRSNYNFIPDDVLQQIKRKLTNIHVEAASEGTILNSTGFWLFKEDFTEIDCSMNEFLTPTDLSHEKSFYVKIDKNYVCPSVGTFCLKVKTTVSGKEYEHDCSINVGNLDVQKEEASKKKIATQSGQSIKRASYNINNDSQNAIVLNGLEEYLNAQQMAKVEKVVYTYATNIIASTSSEYAKEDKVRKKVMKKMGIDDSILSLISTPAASFDMKLNTKKGERIIHFNIHLMNCRLNGHDVNASGGKIDYAVYAKWEYDNTYIDSPEKTGIGALTYTNVQEFISNLKGIAENAIKNGYSVWGNQADQIAEYLTKGTIIEALKQSGVIGSFSDNLFTLLEKPTTNYTKAVVRCPVDVKIFDLDGNLCGEVKDDTLNTNYNDIFLAVDGSEKTIYYSDNSYYLEISGYDTGTMNYSIMEINDQGETVREINYNQIPVSRNITYTAPLLDASGYTTEMYNLIDNNGNQLSASSDTLEIAGSPVNNISWFIEDKVMYIYGEGVFTLGEEYERKDEIEEVVFLEGKIVLAPNAINEFNNITELTVPSSVKVIGNESISSCEKLKKIIIEGDLYWVGSSAFSFNPVLDSVEFRGKVKYQNSDYYEDGLFGYYHQASDNADNMCDLCESLETITLPEGMITLPNYVGKYCTNLKTIEIPSTIRYYDVLTHVKYKVPDDNMYFSDIDGVLFDKDQKKLICFPWHWEGTEYVIPEGTETIGEYAFANADIKELHIAESVEVVEDHAVSSCENLVNILFNDNMQIIGENAFSCNDKLKYINCPLHLKQIGDDAFEYCTRLRSIKLYDELESIGRRAFYRADWEDVSTDIYFSGSEEQWNAISGSEDVEKDFHIAKVYFNSTDQQLPDDDYFDIYKVTYHFIRDDVAFGYDSDHKIDESSHEYVQYFEKGSCIARSYDDPSLVAYDKYHWNSYLFQDITVEDKHCLFDGWSITPDGESIVNGSYIPKGDIDLYAVYKDAVTINYHLIYYDDIEKKVIKGSDYYPEFVRSLRYGYNHIYNDKIFAGWSKHENGSLDFEYYNVDIGEYASSWSGPNSIEILSSMDLYAVWKPVIKIKFDGNGGKIYKQYGDEVGTAYEDIAPKEVKLRFVSEFNGIYAVSNNSEADFKGWCSNREGKGEIISDNMIGQYKADRDMTFYAIYGSEDDSDYDDSEFNDDNKEADDSTNQKPVNDGNGVDSGNDSGNMNNQSGGIPKAVNPTQKSDSNIQETNPLVKISGITLNGISKQIAAGKKFRITATVLPENASNKTLKWSTSNKKIAIVNQSGLVTIKKNTGGKSVKIIAVAQDGSGKQAIWNIKVMKGVVKGINVTGVKNTMKSGKTLKLKVIVKATKGSNKKLKWTSSNPKWATVNAKGVVKALKPGKGKTVKITVMATDGSNLKRVVKLRIQ